jgi:Uncharacterised nucleotidyltransferase
MLPTWLVLGQALGHEPGAASGGVAPAVGPVDWPLLAALASHHLVTPALQLQFKQVAGPLDRELHGYFAVMRSLNRARNRRIRAQLEHLVGALNAVGIEPVLLKGMAHLLLGLYADDADRVIGDIDLLVARENCDAALAVLLEAGYAPHAGELEHAHLHHYPPVAADGSEAWVELHKAASPYHRALPTPALIRRARRIRIGSGWAAAPCPEDLLVHNIVHSQLHNRGFWSAEFALREAYDLVLLARHFGDELDWPRLAARIDADVGKHVAGFYVRRAHRLLGQGRRRSPGHGALAWPIGAGGCMPGAGCSGCSARRA